MIGAQQQNAMLAVTDLVVLALSNLALVPPLGVTGAALAVAVATLVWLGSCAVVLLRVSGFRTDRSTAHPWPRKAADNFPRKSY